MKKKSTYLLGILAILLLFVLLDVWTLMTYRYCGRCVENWNGDEFLTYTGTCVEADYGSGFEGISRYGSGSEYQYFTGQGWHLVFDHGRDFYIPLAYEQELPLCNRQALEALVSKEVTVVCLPETILPCLNIIVSLESEGTIYVDEAAAYGHIVRGMQNIRSGMIPFHVIIIPLLLFGVLCICIEIADARNRRRKEAQKQEKIRRLREQGLLHPSKQRRKNGAGKKALHPYDSG